MFTSHWIFLFNFHFNSGVHEIMWRIVFYRRSVIIHLKNCEFPLFEICRYLAMNISSLASSVSITYLCQLFASLIAEL